MIVSFKDKEAEKIWHGIISHKLPFEIQETARRKSRMLNNSHSLIDLKVPPANKLEYMKGSRKGQYSIRINNQWRICFIWSRNNCYNVEIIDYH